MVDMATVCCRRGQAFRGGGILPASPSGQAGGQAAVLTPCAGASWVCLDKQAVRAPLPAAF